MTVNLEMLDRIFMVVFSLILLAAMVSFGATLHPYILANPKLRKKLNILTGLCIFLVPTTLCSMTYIHQIIPLWILLVGSTVMAVISVISVVSLTGAQKVQKGFIEKFVGPLNEKKDSPDKSDNLV